MSILEPGLRTTLGGHEKFVFRNGWLKKGGDAVQKDPSIFTRDDALVTLGVGKNMVRSIRHWGLATGLLEEAEGLSRSRSLNLSLLGQSLIADGGWDPYFEDVGSLWLIHWQLANNQYRSLIWYLAFAAYPLPEFTQLQMIDFVDRQLAQAGVHTTKDMMTREIECFTRTYMPAKSRNDQSSEESLDCPLAELQLIKQTDQSHVFQFNIGPKISLPTPIFGYALYTYLARVAATRRTVAIDECIYQYGSPGMAFKLDDNSVIEYLEEMQDISSGQLRLVESAGIRQLYFNNWSADQFTDAAIQLLRRYYASTITVM